MSSATEGEEGRRVVLQPAVHLLTGQAGLHDLGFDGSGQTVGFLDDDITSDELAPFVLERLNPPTPAGRRHPTHGDEMAASLVQAAPGARLLTFNVFDRHGSITRSAIREGIEAIRDHAGARLVNVSLQIVRNPAMCSPERPCTACRALREAADAGLIVVVAAGNQGAPAPGSIEEATGNVTCPAAEGGGITVGATTGPPGSSRVDDDPQAAGVSGTSVSVAMVTGGIALLLQAFPAVTQDELKQALAETATILPHAPVAAVGAGRAHFYRAFRYLEHRFQGGKTDPVEAERVANVVLGGLGAVGSDLPLAEVPDDARESMGRAASLAPWSSELLLWIGLLNEEQNPAQALEAAAEAVRLDWTQAAAHRLISRLLERMGDQHGARVEATIADMLAAGQTLAAADTLFEALANR